MIFLRAARNAEKKVDTKRPFTPKQMWAIRFILDREKTFSRPGSIRSGNRQRARECDLVKIKIRDAAAGPDVRARATVVQQKTLRPVQFEINSDLRASLLAWLKRRGGSVEDYAFPSRMEHTKQMSTRHYASLVDESETAIGLRPEECARHSLSPTH